MNTFLSAAALTFAAGASLLHANDEARVRNLENRVTCLENSQNGCCVVNPPARPYAPDCWGFYVSIDPLLWQAHMSGVPIAIETHDSTSLFGVCRNKVRNLDFDFDWGVRLGLGINTNHDAWDLLFQWTHWRTDGKRNFSPSRNGAAFPIQGTPAQTLFQYSKKVESKWDLDYDLLDLENGRAFYVSKCMTLRPFGGLRSAWIKQSLNVDYKDIPVDVQDPISPNNQHSVEKSDRFWGIGIRGGLDIQWGLFYDFSFFTNQAASLLYGYHSVCQDEFASLNCGPQSPLFSVEDFHHVGALILEMQIGMRYDWISCDQCYHVGIDFGWEQHYHPNQNQLLLFTDDVMTGKFVVNQGDLGIQGWFLSVRVDF